MKKQISILITGLSLFLSIIACSSDDSSETDADNGNPNGENATLVNLTEIRQFEFIQPTKQGLTFGTAQNPLEYTRANLYFGRNTGFDIVAGRLETNANMPSTLDMSLLLDRKATDIYNSQFRDSIEISVLSHLFYNNYKDMFITQADVSLNSKNSNAILVDETGEYAVANYPYGCGEGTDWGDAQFFELGNLIGDFLFDDQNTFTQDTIVPITEFMDFRMLTYLRFIASKGNTSSLVALKEDGTVVNFDLNYSSDLLALSHFFDEQEITNLRFEVSGDFDIQLFRGTIRPSESPDGQTKSIEVSNP